MDAILALYAAPPDPLNPVICLDERPYTVRAETRTPLPAGPGRRRRIDDEYPRCGTGSLAVAMDRHRGWRHVWVGERRPTIDVAGWVKDLVDRHYPTAQSIGYPLGVVVDQLTTHTPAAFSAAVCPEEARRLARIVAFHDPPKPGRWLNLVEIEVSVLASQRLDRRLPSIEAVQTEVVAWTEQRHTERKTITWRFTTEDARHQFGRHYPASSLWPPTRMAPLPMRMQVGWSTPSASGGSDFRRGRHSGVALRRPLPGLGRQTRRDVAWSCWMRSRRERWPQIELARI